MSSPNLAPLTTFNLGGTPAAFYRLTNKNDLLAIVNEIKTKALPLFILGGGSNILVNDAALPYAVIKMEIGGIAVKERDSTLVSRDTGGKDIVLVSAGAGVNWDELVAFTVENNLASIEALSGIPGTCGAAPVQNIGAYGQELADSFVSLEAYDLETSVFVTIPKADCAFHYRTSIFKTTAKGRYIIISITLALTETKEPIPIPDYPSLQEFFANKSNKFSLAEIRQAVLAIRAEKLPDPKIIPNVGSFFSHIFVSPEKYAELQKSFPDIPGFPDTLTGKVKLLSSWLIDQCGLKGQVIGDGPLETYKNNALVLTNPHNATFNETLEARDFIIKTVEEKSGVTLILEPEIIQ